MTFEDDKGIFDWDDLWSPSPEPSSAPLPPPPPSSPSPSSPVQQLGALSLPPPPVDWRPPPPRRGRPSAPRLVKARQVQRVVTRIDPWAMLRVALSFSLCVWLIVVVAGIVIWQAAVVTGSIGNIEDFLAQLLAESSFTIDGFRVLQGSVIAGFVIFVSGALFAAITTVLFNLIAQVFGGLRLTVVEMETATDMDDR